MKATLFLASLIATQMAMSQSTVVGVSGQSVLDDGYGNTASFAIDASYAADNYQWRTYGGATFTVRENMDGYNVLRTVRMDNVQRVVSNYGVVTVEGTGWMSFQGNAQRVERGMIRVRVRDAGLGDLYGADTVGVEFVSDNDSYSAVGYAPPADLNIFLQIG